MNNDAKKLTNVFVFQFFSMSGMVRYESVCVLENETNGNTSDDINMKDIVIV